MEGISATSLLSFHLLRNVTIYYRRAQFFEDEHLFGVLHNVTMEAVCCCFRIPLNHNSTSKNEKSVILPRQNVNESTGTAVRTNESTQLCVPTTNIDERGLPTSGPGTADPDTNVENIGLHSNEILSSYVVLFNYVAQNHEELTVTKGEFLEILSKEGDWWLAQKVWKDSQPSRHKKSCSGFVPVEILAKVKSLEEEL